ncbi:hypothetical protein L915_11880 [Phytophthora nicotianae]|uniref:Peptidase S1 domain-containing protein n=1 Tax=Phytophthora nicotianae TaxID=4792 RepID=W2GIP6_PHYNI|nr:hypothetical protein L915_11880 [Phytophthora nicotianae]
MATILGCKTVDTLQTVDVEIIPNAKCAKLYDSTVNLEDSMICADLGKGKDSCDGDSGGPLLVNDVVSYALDFINDIFNGGSNNNVKEFLTFGPEVLRVWEEAVAMSM